MKVKRRLVRFALVALAVCGLLGGADGQRLKASADSGPDAGVSFSGSADAFARVFALVQKNYADPVDPDRAIFGADGSYTAGAIPAMLHTLDPHSNFLTAKDFARLEERQVGKYYGVGMRILTIPGKMGKWVTTVVQPMPGSPAFRAGLRPGDVILQVAGKRVAGLDGDAVAKLLKGPKGTIVRVTVSREGYDKPLDFDVTRDEITGMSVDDAYLIRPGIAYVHIASFTQTTGSELDQALDKLGENDLKGLILDLRGNPGGLLQAAVQVAGHFLQSHQLIVSYYGRRNPEKRFYAEADAHHDSSYPIVVLIDHSTASAAEIVTGALQDHDRALVVGETSFGKGLVQTPYPLSEGTGLLLTTAHYYTPSGRLIQRDYSDLSFYDYIYAHEGRAKASSAEVRHTDGGRVVYGGGGITPDIKVDEPKLDSVEKDLLAVESCPDYLECGPFFDFGKYYLGIHKTVLRDFEPDDQAIQAFRGFVAKKGLLLSDGEVQANLDFIKSHLREVVVDMIYGQDVAQHMSVGNDPLVQKAISDLPQAAALMTNAKKFVAVHGSPHPPI
jgi:carboxyl-terminal processing protease